MSSALPRLVAPALLLGMGCTTSLAPAFAQTAQTHPTPIRVAIGAGTLDEVLNNFAVAAGIQLTIDGALTAGKTSNGLSGSYGIDEGLSALLAGSGLEAARNEAGDYILRKTRSTALPTIQVNEEGSDETASEHTGSYTAHAVTLGRMTRSLRDTPQSVTVVTRQQIEDRNFVALDEVLETVPGISASTANFGSNSFFARGQQITNTLVDGLPLVGGGLAGLSQNMAMYDRVEVQRGAAGLISGAANPGGAINLARKRPTQEGQLGAVARVGSWDNYYTELDASGPLRENGALRGRAVVTYEDRGYFVDLQETRKTLLYAIAEADLGERTTVSAGGSYQDNQFDSLYLGGLPRFSDGTDLRLPRSSRGLSPGWNELSARNWELFADLRQNLASDWTLKLSTNWQWRRQESQTNSVNGAVNPLTLLGPTYAGNNFSFNFNRQITLDALLNGAFEAFGRRHEVMLGANWYRVRSDGQIRVQQAAQPISQSIFNFDPWLLPPASFPVRPGSSTENEASESSIYGAIRLSVSEPLALLIGARFGDWKDETLTYATGSTNKLRENGTLTPYAAATYRLSRAWSAYASYSDSFRVQADRYDVSGSPLDPVVGANYEAGLKGEFHDGRLNTSLAVFRIDEKNRSQVDPDNPAPCTGSPSGGDCYLAEGQVRSKGVDLEASGELFAGLQISAGYTWQTNRFEVDRGRDGQPTTSQGRAFSTITPKHLGRIWAQYSPRGELNRWSAGIGLSSQTETYVQSGTLLLDQGGYTVWSSRLGYRIKDGWNIGLNVNNLTDKVYYQRIGSPTGGNRYGEPRAWALTVRGMF